MSFVEVHLKRKDLGNFVLKFALTGHFSSPILTILSRWLGRGNEAFQMRRIFVDDRLVTNPPGGFENGSVVGRDTGDEYQPFWVSSSTL